ncbi:MAG: response regulator, partial [Candidatus Omnitrophica bacterium]|nr:response regulator [Candidatus Omnitrophota bacterium]
FELCQALRKKPELRELPVIFVTSMNRESEKRRGIEVGAQAYIVKGAFDQRALLNAIERLLP